MSSLIWRPNKHFGAILKAIALLGMAFLFAAGYFYIQAIREEALNLQPLSFPVSLEFGTIKTPDFKTDIESWDYEIAIDFEPKFDLHQMECLLGGKANSDRCKDISSLNDMSWELLEGQRVAAEGSGYASGMLAETGVLYERTIGSFKAQKGHHYTLVLHVNHDASELNNTHPKIVVQIPRSLWEDHAMGIGFGKLAAGILGLVGTTILVGAFAILKVRRE
jgi:hypothetical protein